MAARKSSKSYMAGVPNEYLLIIGVLLLVMGLFFSGNLKLGAWWLPANELRVDTAGIHFYSGHTGGVTWRLEDASRTQIDAVTTSNYGYFNLNLPASSGDYHLFCTGLSGCDAGEWFRINLSALPQSPASMTITGICGETEVGGRWVYYDCAGASSTFVYATGWGKPSRLQCNTCVSRDVNNVPGAPSTLAIIVSAPPVPTPAPTPVATTIPPPQKTPATGLPPTPTPVPTPTPTSQDVLLPIVTITTPAQTPPSPPTSYEPQGTPAPTPVTTTTPVATIQATGKGTGQSFVQSLSETTQMLLVLVVVLAAVVMSLYLPKGKKRKRN